MYKEFLIKEVTQAEAHTIIQSREPRGLFYRRDGNSWGGHGNMTRDAWGEGVDRQGAGFARVRSG